MAQDTTQAPQAIPTPTSRAVYGIADLVSDLDRLSDEDVHAVVEAISERYGPEGKLARIELGTRDHKARRLQSMLRMLEAYKHLRGI